MPIEGPLKELGVHDVFQLLDLTRKTGVLRITSEMRQNAGRVLFDRGSVVGAEMRSSPQRIGTQLVRAGKISEESLARARALRTGGDTRRFGDLLVETGAINRRELERFLRRSVEEVLFELMSWSEGYFTFEETPLDAGDVEAAVRIPTEAILMEAARRIDEWSRMESVLPHVAVVPRLAESGAEGGALDLAPLEWEVLAAIDGARDLRALAGELHRSEFDVARIIFGLVTTGIVAIGDPTRAAIAAVPADADAAVERAGQYLAMGDVPTAAIAAEAVLERFPNAAAAHVLVGRVRQASGDHAAAADAFRHALDLETGRADARRLLGLSSVALGRLEVAVEQWDRWRAMEAATPAELVERPRVERWRAAASLLAEAVKGRHD